MKKLISTALTVVMILTALFTALPVTLFAAYTESGSTPESIIPEGTKEVFYTDEELVEYLGDPNESSKPDPTKYIMYNFDTAAEMLGYELTLGVLYCVSSANEEYTLYINKYTGFAYYVNNDTGQILTSNPIDPGYLTVGTTGKPAIKVEGGLRADIMSQILIEYHRTGNDGEPVEIDSFNDAAVRNQISVTPINNGLRVNYTLGDTTARFLLPGYISYDRFIEAIFMPMAEKYEEMLNEYLGDILPDENFAFFDNPDYTNYDEYGFLNTSRPKKGYRYYLEMTSSLANKHLDSNEIKRLDDLKNAIIQIFGHYSLQSPDKFALDPDSLAKLNKDYPITAEGVSIYVFSAGVDTEDKINEQKNYISDFIKKYCPEYTFAQMFKDEADCLYKDDSTAKPVFRCALEYTFNADGTLSVSLPANSVTFDDTIYTLDSIVALKYFGAGNMTEDGYIFYPDGSGTIVEFDDFYNEAAERYTALEISSSPYGIDYCYSQLENAYREQIIMPVYGIVTDANANELTSTLTGRSDVTNGFFAILEDGSALAKLEYESGSNSHKYASAYASYQPNPSDTVDLSETISVGDVKKYTIVSETKYTGAYTTRYVMLSDKNVGDTVYGEGKYYETSYVGMASYYRNFLEESGAISSLMDTEDSLPLYIEVFGAMDILDRFLTFPITKSIALTTFDDISEMYEQLSDCETYIEEMIAHYEELAENETKEMQKAQYQKEADRYKALVGKVENIKNINFRLTGFANGGMESTYPNRVKWARACGGKSDFKKLVKHAAEISAEDGANFGIFPDFDFMYIHKTKAFDGISNRGTVSRMVDNRYATKQIFDNIDMKFEKSLSLVVAPDVLNKFYGKFFKKYSKYDITGISLSTLGSDLNSDFDKKDPLNREQAMDYVEALLDRVTNEESKKSYDLMIDKGNIFAAQYADHILNIATDSSHLRYASYTVPFTGIVLHSYVNYAGTPINYSGNPDYDLLRSIENGASLYYILCYRNSAELKESETLNKYYGVDYHNWYDNITTTYAELNGILGGLQDHKIVDHKSLIAERVIEDYETEANFVEMKNEIVDILDSQILSTIDDKFDELFDGGSANYGKKIKINIDRAALLAQFAEILNVSVEELDEGEFKASIDKVIAKYTEEYSGSADSSLNVDVNFTKIDYKSKYSYITDSFALDEDYAFTKYTVDNGNVSMVTYQKGDSKVVFILNYNVFSVTVKLDGEHKYVIPAQKYVKIG